MNTDSSDQRTGVLLEKELTEKILGAAFKVHNTLGCGFLERVYENALVLELRRSGLTVKQQRAVQVKYDGAVVGEYVVDLLVSGRVVVECKAVSGIDPVHEAQLLNYLRAIPAHVGLLLNFGRPRLQHRRLVL